MLIGVAVGSWKLALALITSVLLSNLFATAFKFPINKIHSGLYGFNGAITGIAIPFLFGFGIYSIITTIVMAIFSTIAMHVASKYIRPLTSPFILAVWIVLLINSQLHYLNKADISNESTLLNLQASIPRGYGQVLFQSSIWSGSIILFALFLGDKKLATCSVIASVAAVTIGWILPLDNEFLFAGLASYNGLLVAIALGGFEVKKLTIAIVGSCLSTVILYGITKTDMLALTSPFVFVTWIALAASGQFLVKQ